MLSFLQTGLLRRGMAHKGLKMYDKAQKDLLTVIGKEPKNKKAKVSRG